MDKSDSESYVQVHSHLKRPGLRLVTEFTFSEAPALKDSETRMANAISGSLQAPAKNHKLMATSSSHGTTVIQTTKGVTAAATHTRALEIRTAAILIPERASEV